MVQPNTEARPRRSRARRCEEQALLVESHLGIANDVIMDGEGDFCCIIFMTIFSKISKIPIESSWELQVFPLLDNKAIALTVE